jgi:uncharacterized membrane protein YuzA (DUF378 family)
MKIIKIIALILVVVGGLNWGLVGLFDYDLVAAIFGAMSAISRVVYVLVGISAIVLIVAEFSGNKKSMRPAQPM